MLSNFHTHSTYCDGKSTLGDIVNTALDKGVDSIGFSGHGYTWFDLTYCMKDTDGYLNEIAELKHKYDNLIEIYGGVEEDLFSPVERSRFDYIIGSSHYFQINGKYYPIDSNIEVFQKCIALYDGDLISLSQSYYDRFCSYIKRRRPDIIGHFDLLTKFDEAGGYGLLNSSTYNSMAEKYIAAVADLDCIFEVNTGAISRGYRTSPYPAENLLHVLKKHNAKLILSSDSHIASTIDYYFNEARIYLKDVGFRTLMTLHNGSFTEYLI